MIINPLTLDWGSTEQVLTYQEALENALDKVLAGSLENFYTAVYQDAAEALGSASLVASAKRVPDPFAFTNVMKRWYSAVRELAALRSDELTTLGVDPTAIEKALENSNLPLRAYEDVTAILNESREENWTEYRTKRALSKLLIPKESSGKWDSRSAYRVAVSTLARTVATETLGQQSQAGIERGGYRYKTWLSHKDDRVRHTHLASNEQTVRATESFTVGLSKLRFPGDPTAPIGEIANCRCVMKGTNNMPKKKLADTLLAAADPVAPMEFESDLQDNATGELGVWRGTIVLEGTLTGDGRLIEPEALTWDTLPIPLRAVESDVGAHDGAVVVGTIQTLSRLEADENGSILIDATGTFDLDSEAGREAYRKTDEGLMQGVSADLDNMSFKVFLRKEVEERLTQKTPEVERDSEGNPVVNQVEADDEVHVITSARIRAATLVAIPAFEQARIEVLPTGDEDEELERELMDAVAEKESEADYSADTETFNWVEEVGGLPRYIKRISDALQRRGMSESHAIASAVNTVKRWARGGGDVTAKTRAKAIKALAEWEAKKARARAGKNSLTASGAVKTELPPNAWFLDPQLKEATPLKVTPEGRVYGHLATWDTCHVGTPDYCVTPPSSRTGYAYFHTGAIITRENHEVAVGHIVLGTFHASSEKGVTATMSHYDHTGLAVADVRAGEDAYGIWVSGAVRPGVSEADLRTLRSSPLSGDWRRVQGNLELVSALAVNMPGFPIPRPQGAVRNGDMYSLVASGMLAPRKVPSPSSPEALSSQDVKYLKSLLRKERRKNVERMAADLREKKRAKIEAVAKTLQEKEN